MQGAALSIQTCYRGYATKAKIKEAQRKMLEGAKVDVFIYLFSRMQF